MAPPTNRRPGFSKRAQLSIFASYLLAVLGAVVGLLLLIISFIDPQGFSALRTIGAEVTAPISRTLAGASQLVRSGSDELAAYFSAATKNADMQREIAKSRIEILEARALKLENQRLKNLLGLKEDEPDAIALARMISSTASSSRRLATIGVGSLSGVSVGQPVRAPEGLVGRILETGPTTARVLLLSDRENVTPVKRASDGLPAFAVGRSDGSLDIKPINLGVNPFKAGDLLITSGSGGLYSPGIPVAIVITPTETGAIARVLANPARVSHVIVQPVFERELLPVANAPPASETNPTP